MARPEGQALPHTYSYLTADSCYGVLPLCVKDNMFSTPWTRKHNDDTNADRRFRRDR